MIHRLNLANLVKIRGLLSSILTVGDFPAIESYILAHKWSLGKGTSMETQLRIKKLKEIVDGKPCAQKDIHYKGRRQTMAVFDIPLEYLIYNQYNGRIATFVKTYERQHHPIDATTDGGKELIAKFLWESKESRNRTTQEDLHLKGQLEYGIVTADGVIIDGNRRFMLLEKNKEKYKEATAYFKAIILEDTLEGSKKEVIALETTYQMGVDEKVDYNPIQKYLKCRDLIEQGFSEGEIAKMMGELESKIKEYLSILGLMDEYLKEYEYEGMYRVLETEKLESQFIDLNNYLSKYRGEQGRVHDMNWTPNPEDIDELQKVYFGYMRARFGVHDIRIIANPSKGQGIFTKKDLWENFANNYFNAIEKIEDEKSLQEMREENPTIQDVVSLISTRDSEFQKKVDGKLKGNLGRTSRELEDQNSADEPLELMQRAKKTLEKVKTEVQSFGTPDIRNIAKEIEKLAYDLKKAAEDKIKAARDKANK